MLKFKHETNEDVLVGFGIEEANVKKLKEGQPIAVDMEQFGYPNLKIMIWYGQTMGDLYKEVEPFIGPKTKIIPTEKSA